MTDDEGASPREIVVEACRRDQPHLLEDVVTDSMADRTAEQLAEFLNGVTDTMGNYCLHICATYGSYDAMDYLFDIRGFECDPLTRLDRNTPLHLAVRHANEKDSELGHAMVTMMCEAGCDPRVRNAHGLKPVDLALPQLKDVRAVLQRTEYILREGVLAEDEEQNNGSDGPSDSDNEAENGRR